MSPPTFSLGIDLGGTKIEAALFDPHGVQVWRRRTATPAGDYAATLRTLAAEVAQAHSVAASLAAGTPMTVGMGTPGTQAASGRMKKLQFHLPQRHAAAGRFAGRHRPSGAAGQ